MMKTILRNNIVLFYILMGISAYVILLFMSIKLDPEKVNFSESFHLYLLLSLAINIISSGYFIFGLTFDYHRMLNFSFIGLFKKYIVNNIIIMIISTFVGFSILLLCIYFFNNKMINDYIYLSFLNALFNIPPSIILNIFATQRLSLFDNKFIMAAQMPRIYVVFIVQFILASVFYYIFSKMSYTYIFIMLIIIYLLLFINLNKIAQYLKYKVRNEYIRNK